MEHSHSPVIIFHSPEANISQAISVSPFMEPNITPLFLRLTKLIQSTSFLSISWWFTLILSFHIHLAIAKKDKYLRVLDFLSARYFTAWVSRCQQQASRQHFLSAWYFTAMGLQMSTTSKPAAFHVCFSCVFSYLLYNHNKPTSLQDISKCSWSFP